MTFSIGQVSKLLSVKVHTLRYWEEVAPLLRPQKNTGGWRAYNASNIRMLLRFRHLVVDLNFTVEGACHQLIREASEKRPSFEMCKYELLSLLARVQGISTKVSTRASSETPQASRVPPRSAMVVALPRLYTEKTLISPRPIMPATDGLLEKDLENAVCACVFVFRSGEKNIALMLSSFRRYVGELEPRLRASAPFVLLVSPCFLSIVQEYLVREQFLGIHSITVLPLQALWLKDGHKVISTVVEAGISLRMWCQQHPRIAHLSMTVVTEPFLHGALYESHRRSEKPLSFLSEKIGISLYTLRNSIMLDTSLLSHIEDFLAYGKWRLNFSTKPYEHLRDGTCFECFQGDIAGSSDVNVFVSQR